MKKIKFWLSMFDGLWSIPLSILGFWLIGFLMQSIFNLATGAYDLAFFQPLFLAVAVVITGANAARLGLRFNFKSLHRYLYGTKDDDGTIINVSKFDWQNLTEWQRFLVTLFIYFSLFWGVVIVFVFAM